ncbi:MAG TPA: xanthine dehydrogenase family protein subunit M [Candidatus Acidoferrum sp.]|nr:xanthine dehydrogenase family protein subunit M [Candidatus Acidoferrum sp.]
MTLSDIDVLEPKALGDALNVLRERSDRIKLIAGGTDAIIQLKDRTLQAKELLDISGLSELRYIRGDGRTIRIGALSTYSDIVESSLLNQSCRVLVDASKMIGSLQIQNRATIGGNLANASPAGDTIPPLYALAATITVQNHTGTRHIPIERFFLGYRKIDLRPDELITEISFEAVEKPSDAAFLKVGLREGHFISVANLAVWIQWARAGIKSSDIRVALGAVAPVVIRARKCEEFLRGRALEDDVIWQAGQIASGESSPISDIRASAEYRRAVTSSLLYKAMHALIESHRAREKP